MVHNEAWEKLVSCDQDVTSVMRWWLVKKAKKRYLRMAMAVGGVREVIQETCLTIIRSPCKDISCHWTTAAVNQTRWTLLRMVKQHSKRESSEAMFLGMSHEWNTQDTQVATTERIELFEAMHFCMKRVLNYRERSIVEQRMQDATLDEVAVMFKVTRERIRQIEGRAIRKLKDPRVACVLFEFLD